MEEFINDINYLDQHFLIDNRVINTFIDTCNLKITDTVVEIGPGKCVLSEIIAKKVGKLLLIERDIKLEHFINVLMDKYKNVYINWSNVLNSYIPKCNKIVSSLPYSITEPFIEKLIRCDFEECILITGDNYASNVIVNNTNKLSLLTNSFFKTEKIMDITPDAFSPSPRVMSSLIKLTKIKREDLLDNPKMFIIRELFFRRSSKLKNSLMEAYIEYNKKLDKKLTKKESKSIIEKLEFDKDILNKEIEQLSNDDFNTIFTKIKI